MSPTYNENRVSRVQILIRGMVSLPQILEGVARGTVPDQLPVVAFEQAALGCPTVGHRQVADDEPGHIHDRGIATTQIGFGDGVGGPSPSPNEPPPDETLTTQP